MPEGPEVRRAADRIARALGDAPLVAVDADPDRPDLAAAAGLVGQRLQAADTRGKVFLLRFSGDQVLKVHLQLYGVWAFPRAAAVDGRRLPPSRRRLRVGLHGPEASALLYSASEITLMSASELAEDAAVARLGPDPLDPSLSAAEVEARLDLPAFRGRGLGALLLDQGFFAGVGNYLRSEILFEAGLDPARRPRDLRPDERAAFAAACLGVCRRALATGGVTTPGPLAAALRAEGLGRRALRHMVFGRAGAPCRACGGPVERLELAGRRLYRCGRCQR